jgi:hypothetical protein
VLYSAGREEYHLFQEYHCFFGLRVVRLPARSAFRVHYSMSKQKRGRAVRNTAFGASVKFTFFRAAATTQIDNKRERALHRRPVQHNGGTLRAPFAH